jgi:hypothetical protein
MNNKENNNKRFKNNAERMAYLNQKESEIAERQEKNLVLDFDKALEEETKSQIEIKLLGRSYFLPTEMPFNFSTFFLRNCYKKIKGQWTVLMPEDKVLPFIELMFGKKFINQIENSKDNRISLEFVMRNIVPKVMEQWGYKMNNSKENAQKKMQIQG